MNKLKPLVSVCVQTYQHVNYIGQCLEGILMQKTDFKFEIILGEDESQDGTRQICVDYAQKYPEIINLFLRSRKDVIYIGSKPTGRFNFIENMKASTGKYLAICEGDDFWTDPLKLQKQVDFLENNLDYSLCFHPCKTLKEINGELILTKQLWKGIDYRYSFQNLLTYWNIPTASLMIRKDYKMDFPKWFSQVASGDIALVMLYFEKGNFKLLKDYMSVYRISDIGISSSHVDYRMIHYRAVLYSHLNEYFNYKYEKEIYDALHHIYLNFAS